MQIAAAKWEPFMHYSRKSGFSKGIEFFMINTAAEAMQIRPEFTIISNEEMNYFGSSQNGTLFFDKVLSK